MKKIKTLVLMLTLSVIGLIGAGCNSAPDWIEQAACTHQYGDVNVLKDATCTKTGEGEKTCELCGKVEKTKISVKGHTYDEALITKLATCTEKGEEVKTCNDCGLEVKSVIAATGHAWDSGVVTEEATCAKNGSKDTTCMNCYEVKTQPIAKLPHTIVAIEGVEATCTETGLTEGSVCAICDTVVVPQSIIPAKGHTIVSTDAIPATCDTAGQKAGTSCSVCDEVFVEAEIIPARGHKIVTVGAVEPTCTSAGYKGGTQCTSCGKSFSGREYIDALGHEYAGIECVRCGSQQDLTIDFFKNFVENEYIQYAEANVGDSVAGRFIRVLSVSNWSIKTTNATFCVRDGSPILINDVPVEERSSSELKSLGIVAAYNNSGVFFVQFSEEVPAKLVEKSDGVDLLFAFPEHNTCVKNSGYIKTEPTCSEQGELVYSCKYCGIVMDSVLLAKLDHDYQLSETLVAPDCVTAGEAIYTCAACGDEQTVELPANGHRYIGTSCTVCGELRYEAKGLTYKNTVLSFDNRPKLIVTATMSSEFKQDLMNAKYSNVGWVIASSTAIEGDNNQTDFITRWLSEGVQFKQVQATVPLGGYEITTSISIDYKDVNTEFVVIPYVVQDGQFKYAEYPSVGNVGGWTDAARSATYLAAQSLNNQFVKGTMLTASERAKYDQILNESAHLYLGYSKVCNSCKGASYVIRAKNATMETTVGNTVCVDFYIYATHAGVEDKILNPTGAGFYIPFLVVTNNPSTVLLTGVYDLKTAKVGESTFTYYEKAKIGSRTFVETLKEGTAIVGVYDFNAKSFDNGSIVSTVLNVA